jgi:hypothetical protein
VIGVFPPYVSLHELEMFGKDADFQFVARWGRKDGTVQQKFCRQAARAREGRSDTEEALHPL